MLRIEDLTVTTMSAHKPSALAPDHVHGASIALHSNRCTEATRRSFQLLPVSNDAHIQNEQIDLYFIMRAPFLGHDLGI